MSLLQITEPGSRVKKDTKKIAIGIDLGTTNSLLAFEHEIITKIASVVTYKKDNKVIVGQAELQLLDPKNTIGSVKRFLGRSLAEIEQKYADLPYEFNLQQLLVSIITCNGAKNVVEIAAAILIKLKQDFFQFYQRENPDNNYNLEDIFKGAVITLPAYFNDEQRQAIMLAARLANIKILRLLNEPTAAAIAYGLDSKEQGLIAVFDLGGGTFDISILRLERGVFAVQATGGDSQLGGDDFDELIYEFLVTKYNLTNLDIFAISKLKLLVRQYKHLLSTANEVSFKFESKNITLTLEQYNLLILPLVKKTILCCRRVLRDAKISASQLTNIVMVGGATRTPLVISEVATFFKKEPLVDINPDTVVALGAAIQANALVGNSQNFLLLDVVPLSLGIETLGGLVEPIIRRNTSIPIERAQDFTTFQDGQTSILIHIVQGERDKVDDCRSLGKFILTNIPPMLAGAAQIRVTFKVDNDGLLTVSAYEKKTLAKASIEVKPAFGLDIKTIELMLKDSFKNAAQDINVRKITAAKLEAQRLQIAIESALHLDGKDILSENEYKIVTKQLARLNLISSDLTAKDITKIILDIKNKTDFFAMKRMNMTIKGALTGVKVQELE